MQTLEDRARAYDYLAEKIGKTAVEIALRDPSRLPNRVLFEAAARADQMIEEIYPPAQRAQPVMEPIALCVDFNQPALAASRDIVRHLCKTMPIIDLTSRALNRALQEQECSLPEQIPNPR